MKLLTCSQGCQVHRTGVYRAQTSRLRGARLFTAAGQRCRPILRATEPATAEEAAGNVIQQGPRCYLEPSGDGEGLVEICITEGKLDIGIADSDYYFTASTVSERQLKLGVFAKNANADRMGAANLDGKEIAAGSFVELKEGQELEFEDGKRYIVRVDEGNGSGSPAKGPTKRFFVDREARGAGPLAVTGFQDLQKHSVWYEYGHKALALGVLYIMNKALAIACKRAGITFPSPLIGMFMIMATLLALDRFSKEGADKVQAFFNPALNWIQRWLPLFYVPTLVFLPQAVRGIAGADLAKILGIVALGMPASLVFTAQVAVSIRKLVETKLEDTPTPKKLPPFKRFHYSLWGLVLAVSFIGTAVSPDRWGVHLQTPFMLGSTVMGYLVGTAIPSAVSTVLHPLVTCALVANVGAFAYTTVSGLSFDSVAEAYLSKGKGAMGAGTLLMSFLGVVILSFGFRIFGQRRLMKRHAPEIFGATTLSAAFSLFSTAYAARVMGLAPELARALVPRSVTVALALPIAAQLHAPASITAAGVCLTGLLGANFVQALLDLFRFRDPIARGLATAGSAHGLGTAALARNEPEALPFCALAYSLIGIISTLLVSIPPIAELLMKITAA